ncbi:unnamed protein product [Merluccius merluccius]
MPLNIRAKPSQSKLSAASKAGGHSNGSATSRFSRSPKQSKGKEGSSSIPGCRSGLEPGSVSGGGPSPTAKPAARPGPSTRPGPKPKPRGAAASDARRATNSATAPGGKTFSMENIQSVSAAYATSGTMYPSDHDALEPSGGYPKGTMTLGRSTGRASYTGRSTAMGSSPNITFSGIPQPLDPYGNQNHHLLPGGPSSLRGHPGRQQPTQDCAGHGEGSTLDLQAQLRELQKENEQLKREMDDGRDGRMKSGTVNSVNFWSPEMKRDRGVRREEGVRNSMPKEQYRANQEDCQQLPLTVQELQEELRAHREMNSRLQQQQHHQHQQQQQQQSNSGCYRDYQVEQDPRGATSPGHSPRQSPGPGSISLLSPVPRHSPRAHSPSSAYNPRTQQQQQQADIIIHSPGYCQPNTEGPTQSTQHNSVHPGPSGSHGQHIHYSSGCTPNGPAPGLCPSSGSTLQRPPPPPRSPCLVPGCDGFSSPPPLDPTAAEEGFQRLQTEHERKATELALLRRTMEEMELRIEVQKKTLGARDESIQRLLEMLQGQGGQGGRAPKPGIITMATTHDADAHMENLHVREVGTQAGG